MGEFNPSARRAAIPFSRLPSNYRPLTYFNLKALIEYNVQRCGVIRRVLAPIGRPKKLRSSNGNKAYIMLSIRFILLKWLQSIVGSIGVVSRGFGFPNMLERIGVERRLFTAGDNKARSDPFLPTDPKDVEKEHRILADLHELFKVVYKISCNSRQLLI